MMQVLIAMFAMFIFNQSWTMAVLMGVGAIFFFVVNIIMRQETMLYVPLVAPGMQLPSDNPEGMKSPADKKMPYEDVFMQTSDGLRIHGWFMPAGDETSTKRSCTLLFCHANAGNIGLRIPNFDAVVKTLKVNVFAIDYRGYGHSEGTPTEDGLIEDALTAWRWLKKSAQDGRFDANKIFVFGRSLGGAVAIALAAALEKSYEGPLPRGLILENTFTSISAVVDAMFPLLAFEGLKKRFLRLSWASLDRVRDLEVPLLFLTGEKDELIPPAHSRALLEKAELSRLTRNIVFQDGHHNDTWEKGGEKYWAVQKEFIKECLRSEPKGNMSSTALANLSKQADNDDGWETVDCPTKDDE